MNNLKEVQPKVGDWVVACWVEKLTGHVQAQLCQWSETIEASLLESDLSSFWVPALEPAIARINGAITANILERDASRDHVVTLDTRVAELEALLEELEGGLDSE